VPYIPIDSRVVNTLAFCPGFF